MSGLIIGDQCIDIVGYFESERNEMELVASLQLLLSWAVHLSQYSAPEQPPAVHFEPHSFFVEHVCGGKECRAVGWYNDQGIIYIDEKYQHEDSRFAASLLVHEMVHYLQHLSGNYDSHSCEDSVAREREAYYIQNEYILQAHASFDLIHPAPTSCSYKVAFNADVNEE